VVQPRSGLEQNFYNLFQLIVRYGERPIEMDEEQFTIGEVIIYTIEGDQIQPPQPVYQTMIDEFKAHYKDPGFKAETFFKFHPDPAVSALAIDMIADKYRFAETDAEKHLGELVTRLLYEIKLTVINMQIENLEERLKKAQAERDDTIQLQLLAYHPALINQRNEICKLLGNRVIQ
jgi:DNA primase